MDIFILMLLSRMGVEPKAAIAEITDRWKLSCDKQRAIDHAVRNLTTLLQADQLPWSVVQPILSSKDADTTVGAAAGWANAFGQSSTSISYCQVRLSWPQDRLDPPPLLTGDTLRLLGYKPGPNFREVLQAIRNSQLDLLITTESEAIALANQMLNR